MNSPKRKRQSCLKSAAFETPQTRQVCKEKTEDGRNQEKDSHTLSNSPGINVSVHFCNLKINYSVCRLVETYLDNKKCIKSGPSLDCSLVSFISSVSLLSGSIWLYINKKLIYLVRVTTNWMRGYSCLMDWTEMWSKVNILMTWPDLTWDTMTRLCLFSDFSLFLCCRLAVTVTLFKTEFKKAFVMSWLHLFHWISVKPVEFVQCDQFQRKQTSTGNPKPRKNASSVIMKLKCFSSLSLLWTFPNWNQTETAKLWKDKRQQRNIRAEFLADGLLRWAAPHLSQALMKGRRHTWLAVKY